MSQNNLHCHSNMSRHRSKWTEISVIRRQRVNPGSINLVITICDYNEEYDDDKELDRIVNTVGPGLPRNYHTSP